MPSDFPGTFEEFVATLPDSLQSIAELDKQMLYGTAQKNAAIALSLEGKRKEIGRILKRLNRELEERGLTFEMLLAFQEQERGGSPFNRGMPDYLLPPEWR